MNNLATNRQSFIDALSTPVPQLTTPAPQPAPLGCAQADACNTASHSPQPLPQPQPTAAHQDRQELVALGTLQAMNPKSLIIAAAKMAEELSNVIKTQNLAIMIQGKQYVKCEGWTTLGIMLGCTAREVETIEQNGIYISIVELIRMNDGACISRASAECGADDEKDRNGKPIWANRPRYARRSMAQTRATAKACRLAFSWIMALTGYQTTPAEEMIFLQNVEQIQTQQEQPQIAPTQLISASQKRMLESKIYNNGLEREWVKGQIRKAFKVEHFQDLAIPQFEQLLTQIEKWRANLEARNPRNFGHDRDTDIQDSIDRYPDNYADDCPF